MTLCLVYDLMFQLGLIQLFLSTYDITVFILFFFCILPRISHDYVFLDMVEYY